MSDGFEYLAKLASHGRLSRRAFLGRVAALGASAAVAGTLADRAFAQSPIRGGILKAGLRGGASSDSLDPALISSQLPINFCKMWGEFLARMTPNAELENLIAEEFGASDQGRTWTIKIRDGIEFHNGKTVTAEDVAATLRRHSDEKSQSGAYGILKNITGI
jgi:peptide/nickel transport system substrate-binding protein